MRKLTFLTLLAVCLMLAVSCQRQDTAGSASGSEGDVGLTLDSLELKYSQISFRTAEETWQKLTDGYSDSLAFFQRMERSVMGQENVFDALRNGRARLDSEVDERRYDLLYPRVLQAYLDNSSKIYPLADSLREFYSQDWRIFETKRQPLAQIREVVEQDNNRSNRELAYRALATSSEEHTDQLGRLFRMRNQAAKKMGFNDYFRLAGSAVSDDYRKLIDDVDEATKEAYEQTLRGLQSQNAGPPEVWDWHHTYLRAFTEVDRSFPVDSQMTFVYRSFDALGFKLTALPIFFHITEDTSTPAFATTVVVDAPADIRVVANLVDGFASMQRLMGAVGLAVRAAEVSQEDPLFARANDQALLDGIQRFFAHVCYRPEWLKTYGKLSDGAISRFGDAARSIELLSIRLMLVNARFEFEAYQNPNRNLNNLYWDMFAEYTSLPKHTDLSPWASCTGFLERPLTHGAHLQSAVIAAQTMDYVVDNYGGVADNADIRAFLVQNYFRFGSRYPWRELVERGTGQGVSPHHLIAR